MHLGATKQKLTIAFAATTSLIVGGGALAFLGEDRSDDRGSCSAMENGLESPCFGAIQGTQAASYEWTVTEEATFTLSAVGTGNDPERRLWPEVEVQMDGELVVRLDPTGGAKVVGTFRFEAGRYVIAVNDAHSGYAESPGESATFELNVVEQPSGPDNSETMAAK